MPQRQSIRNLRDLLSRNADALIYRCVAGSHAYGTDIPGSDIDLRGVYVLPAASYLAIARPVEQVADERSNEIYYALRRFLELAVDANPNIVELLYMPPDCVTLRTPCADRLIAARGLFITKRAYDSHVGYALAQIKRARGRNKWVNNPKPESPPRKEAFCWFMPREASRETAGAPPYRPIPLAEARIDLAECHAAAVEHCSGIYRLYHYGADARGVFRGDSLVCESIPEEDEARRCIGLLVYNRADFEKALREHRDYRTWRRERNEARWLDQERGEIDYDAKNMMHTFRLLFSGKHIFREGAPLVRFEGETLEFLRRVRAGEFAYDDLIARAEAEVEELAALRDNSTLPEIADRTAIADLLHEITEAWARDEG